MTGDVFGFVTAAAPTVIRGAHLGGSTVAFELVAPGEAVQVKFENVDRQDFVVSARDDNAGMPGGTKRIRVLVNATDKIVTLTIRRRGSSGSAIFLKGDGSPGTNTTQVVNGAIVRIKGGDVSDLPRNMVIEASVEGQVVGRYLFTVFRVDPEAFTSGLFSKAVPQTVTNHEGDYLLIPYRFAAGDQRLGYNILNNDVAWGGIAIRGKIFPSGMDPADFTSEHSRESSFNWDRRRSGRTYDGKGCVFTQILAPNTAAADDLSDDFDDIDEDLTLGRDGSAKDLFIWVIDAPAMLPAAIKGTKGAIQRNRDQFVEAAYYAGTRVSRIVPWYFRSSQINQGPTQFFVELKGITGDNAVGVGITPLTPNLGSAAQVSYSITGVAPTSIEQGVRTPATITGKGFNNPCIPLIYLVNETATVTETRRTFVPFEIFELSDTEIKGAFRPAIGDPLGDYTLKMFIGTQVVEAPQKVKVVPIK